MSDYVLVDDDLIASARTLVGGKAATLAAMRAAGVPVPRLAAVTAAAFKSHLAANAIALPEPSSNAQDLDANRQQISDAAVPEDVRGVLIELHDSFVGPSGGAASVAVRSSGADEDGAESSYAGQFSSYLAVRGHEPFLQAVKDCWASFISDRSTRYRAARTAGEPLVAAMGVVVQAQLYPSKAGVLFTHHPMSADGSLAYVEANFGTGESVVAATTLPDGLAVNRDSGDIVDVAVGDKPVMTVVRHGQDGSATVNTPVQLAGQAVLIQEEVRELMKLGLRIETLLGGPQDIEWAVADATVWIVQSRPTTVRRSG